MKSILSVVFVMLFYFQGGFQMKAQTPDLGAASSFAVFSSVGAFTNTGATMVTGDIGTNVGAFTGFPPGVVIGSIHVADAISAEAAVDVDEAYGFLSTVTCGQVLGTTLGNDQILTPDVYCLGAASTLNGTLFLDGQCDSESTFIIKIDGALSTTELSEVVLINGASICNIYWQINGAVHLGEGSTFLGTILANGELNLLEGASLKGRALSRVGAVSLHNNIVDLDELPSASIIISEGSNEFCLGENVILTGNCGGTWSTGETTNSITVSTNGTYFVTNSNSCGSAISNEIEVTVFELPICLISGDLFICSVETSELCVPPGAQSYLWSTGETGNCITVDNAGDYSVTITNADNCISSCSATVVEETAPSCSITGDLLLCEGQSTELCVPAGAQAYLWSTGATGNCISVDEVGIYSVTITYAGGCTSVCSATVIQDDEVECSITGILEICEGQSTDLCVPAGAEAYLWSTGATTNCISVDEAGIYSVTITYAGGCTRVCSATVIQDDEVECSITGNFEICEGQSTELCVPAGAEAYLWSNGATTNCISVDEAGIYSVTITYAGGCTSVCSATVVVDDEVACSITGNLAICEGQSTELCVPAGAEAYLWSTGATTNCISVDEAGIYSVTITYAGGCTSVCSATVIQDDEVECSITGILEICEGQSTELCVPVGAEAYLWSTGVTINCISVNEAGIYSVTITYAGGCTSVCSATVVISQETNCIISGNLELCPEGFTELCLPLGAETYLWNTGDTSRCIIVETAGDYSAFVNFGAGCTSFCSVKVIEGESNDCIITGECVLPCSGQPVILCAPVNCLSYLWSTGETTRCVIISTPGIYSVTVTYDNGCTSVCSRTVTLETEGYCNITGNCVLSCSNPVTTLCAPANCASYWWSTGEMTRCIDITEPGFYSVTVTYANGCESVCSRYVTLENTGTCVITGDCVLPCNGEATVLCAPVNCVGYLWSTGEITRCISVSTPGIYSVEIIYAIGCIETCYRLVTLDGIPDVKIVGSPEISCDGDPTLLCGPSGQYDYLWSNGDTTSCMIATTPGEYCLTISSHSGCQKTVCVDVIQEEVPFCEIAGDTILQNGVSLLCAPSGFAYYLWSTGETTSCIIATLAMEYNLVATTDSGCSTSCSIQVNDISTSLIYTNSGNDSDGMITADFYPNPFSHTATLEFVNKETASQVVIDIYNVNGALVKRIFEDKVIKDEVYKVAIDAFELEEAVYLCRIVNGSQIIVKKIVVMH